MDYGTFVFTDLKTLADCIDKNKCRLVTSTLNQARFEEALNADPHLDPELHQIGQQLKAGKMPLVIPFMSKYVPSVFV